MCFSASISFGASVIIGGIGIASIRKAKTLALKVFAFTPLFFGIQQFVEGFLWLALQNPDTTFSIFGIPKLTSAYLVFAWILWPAFISYFMFLLEQNSKRKTILRYMYILGIVVSLIMTIILFNVEMKPSIDGHHIFFERFTRLPGILMLSTIYVFLLIGPFFVSTTKYMVYLGMINLISFFIARWFFTTHFISVWCFFAAISSVYIFFMIHQLMPQKQKFVLVRKNIHSLET